MAASETRFTPGPWKVGPVDDTVVTGPDGSEIAAIDGDYNEPDLWPIMEANARLIASAPALYAALKELASRIQRYGDWDEGCFYYNKTSASELQTPLAEAAAALKLAEGA